MSIIQKIDILETGIMVIVGDDMHIVNPLLSECGRFTYKSIDNPYKLSVRLATFIYNNNLKIIRDNPDLFDECSTEMLCFEEYL